MASLSGDPFSHQAVDAALQLKGYARSRPLLCVVRDTDQARALADSWPVSADRLSAAFWPGPLTLVVVAGDSAPSGVSAGGAESGRQTIAVRWSSDETTQALLDAWGGPLFSTSANPRSEPATSEPVEAYKSLAQRPGGDAIAVVIRSCSRPGGGEPSTIVDVTSSRPRLLRRGALSVERLAALAPDLEG